MFKNLSNFSNTSDYLPILNGAIIADIIIILMVYYNFFGSKFLKDWYLKLNINAVIADVLILVIGFILTRFFYFKLFDSYSLIKFTGLFLFIQIVHDILFYIFFEKIVPKGSNKVFDLFKSYAKEVGGGAILGDSFMVLLTIFIAKFLGNYSLNTNIITLIVSIYIIPYIIYF
jgi:uncharacterized protein YacL